MGNHTNRGQVHDRLNHLLEDADYTYSYTTNGQLSQKVSKSTGEITEYTWNVEGKIVQTTVKKADGSIKSVVVNRFDAFRRRITRETSGQLSRFAYDGEDLIIEFGSNNTIQAIYLHGPGIDEPIAMARDLNENGSMEENEVFFYSKDHLNSVHDLTDSEGRPVQRYNYTAYGRTKIERMSTTPFANFVQNPFAYTSREWEQETGDYYYRARNYNPYSGRFLSEDSVVLIDEDPNLYRYTHNNPVLYYDPSGYQSAIGIPVLITPIVIGIGAGMCLNKLQEITKKKNQCQQEYNDRYLECLTRPDKDLIALCIKNSKIALDLCMERAEGVLK